MFLLNENVYNIKEKINNNIVKILITYKYKVL